MKKILKASLILSAVLFCSCMFAFTVTNGKDDNSIGSLRYVIRLAEEYGGNVVFDTGVNTITLTQGAISITSPITIEGSGQTIQFSTEEGCNNNRVFYITTSSSADTTEISNLTIDGGDISANTGKDGNGAGILLQSGNLVLDNVIVQSGIAAQGAGIYVGGSGNSASLTLQNGTAIKFNAAHTGGGGGIYVDKGGTLTVNDSSICSNYATNYGGGIYTAGTTTINNKSLVNSNTAVVCGGGIYVDSGATLTIQSGTNAAPYVQGNTAYQSGGGIYVNNGGTLSGTSFYTDRNYATCNGGGICVNTTGNATLSNAVISNNTAQNGGGVFTISTTGVTIDKTTYVTSNTATGNGGGICVDEGGILTLDNALVGQDNSIPGGTTGPNNAIIGAGICVKNGNVNISDNSRISGNIAGDCTLTGAGGGIYVYTGSVIVDSSIVGQSGNIGAPNKALNGGGIGVDGGTVTIQNGSQINQNTATALGGGLYIIGGTVNLPMNGDPLFPQGGSFIENNSAAWGAGVYVHGLLNHDATFTASYSTISYNSCQGTISNDQRGGGICSIVGHINLNQVTVDNNTCNYEVSDGAGIFNEGGDLNITRSTIAYNSTFSINSCRGGGVYNGDLDVGYTETSSCIIVMSTIYGNTSGYGGGVCDYGDGVVDRIYSATIVNNSSDLGIYQSGSGIYSYGAITDVAISLLANKSPDAWYCRNSLNDVATGGNPSSQDYNIILVDCAYQTGFAGIQPLGNFNYVHFYEGLSKGIADNKNLDTSPNRAGLTCTFDYYSGIGSSDGLLCKANNTYYIRFGKSTYCYFDKNGAFIDNCGTPSGVVECVKDQNLLTPNSDSNNPPQFIFGSSAWNRAGWY